MQIRAGSERGVTLLEVVLMLIATTAVAAALVPALASTLGEARHARATADMEAIRDAILAFQDDTLLPAFTRDGTPAGTPLALLVSDGDIPNAGAASAWMAPAGTAAAAFLEEHLVLNSPGGGAYATGGPNAWRGAYINAPVDPDPWGNRYGVNVEHLGTSSNDVVVFSAGPDEAVDTPDTANPLAAGGDDIVVLVEA
jgi:hypothetical protein